MDYPIILKFKKNNSYMLLSILIFFALTIINYSVQAQSEDQVEVYNRASVNLDGYNLFYVRGIASYSAEKRASLVNEKLELIASQTALPPDSIKIMQFNDYDEVKLGDIVILRVFDSDGKLEGVNRAALSMGAKLRITQAIKDYRYDRTREALIKKLIYSLAAILIGAIVLITFRFLIRRMNLFLEARLKKRFELIESKSFQLIRSNQIWITISGFIRVLKFIINIIIIFFTAQYVLGQFPWTRFISVSLIQLFTKPFSDFGMALLNFLPDLAFLIVIFFIAKYSLKLIKLFFLGLGEGNITLSGFQQEWALPSYKLVRIFIIAFAVIVAYPYIPGSDSAAFKGVSVFIGILFSLGSSSVIGNIMAGYSMTYRRTFRIGDVVQIDNHLGKVTDVKLFVTRLLTFKNEEIIIPNSTVLNTNVVNYSSLAQEKGLILYTTVGIGYETPWRLVESMLKLAADRTQGILKDPPPFVFQKSLGDFAVTYELNVYTYDPLNRMKTYNELHQNILDIFNENNVQIMTPAYEGDPDKPKVVPKEQWFTPVLNEPVKEKTIKHSDTQFDKT